LHIVSIDRPRRARYYDVTLDQGGVVRLSAEVLAQSAFRPGQEVTTEAIEAARQREARYRAVTAALRLLSLRPRSEREIRDALKRRATPEEVITETLERLASARLIDDGAFAENYVELRDRSSPRSRRLLAAELAARGVSKAEREGALATVDEADAAYRAAGKKARSMGTAAKADFQRRLGEYLLRRGFSYDTAREATRRLWDERPSEPDAPTNLGTRADVS
jgi:regulatory protein